MKVAKINSYSTDTGINYVKFGRKKTRQSQTKDFVTINQKINKKPKHEIKNLFIKYKNTVKTGLSSTLAVFSALFLQDKNNTQLENIASELKENAKLQEEKETLSECLGDTNSSYNFDKEKEIISEEINSSDLNYDILTPPVKNDAINTKNKKTVNIEMSKSPENTTNRADAKELDYPAYFSDKPYHFTFPQNQEMKITKTEPKDFEEQSALTNISENYANSIEWDDDKIARDLLQNFFDGHGQTLDGVEIEILPLENGRHKVKISGKSTYDYDKAIMLGESSKKDNLRAAGNYGEGLKMVILKLLKEKGAKNVNISSNNWNVEWSLKNNAINENRVLGYELRKSKQLEGSFIEFETDSDGLIKSILNSYDRFYHYNNPAFKEPEFENDLIGIKYTQNPYAQGKIFIAGQAFEVQQHSLLYGNSVTYDGIEGMNIFIKERPPKKVNGKLVLDTSRDRIALNNENFKVLGEWLSENDNLSDEDFTKLLHALDKCWEDFGLNFSQGRKLLDGLLQGKNERANRLNIIFPDGKKIATSLFYSSMEDFYKSSGYEMCNSSFGKYGMKTIQELVSKSRQHKALIPNANQEKKIKILKKAISLLSEVLDKNKFFTQDELDAKIYLFDNKSENENKAYSMVEGEAIIESGTTKGFWLDINSLNKKSFSEMLGVCLHELTHKYGPDDSDIFSFRLTDVIKMLLGAFTENPNLVRELKLLDEIWNSIPKE